MFSKLICRRKVLVSLCLLLLLLPTLVSADTPITGQASFPVIGNPFPIAEVHPNTEDYASVAYDETRKQFLVVNTNEGALNATCFSSTGKVIATYVVGNGSVSDIAYNKIDDQYMIVFQNVNNIEANTVAGSCCHFVGCSGAPFPISGDRPVGTDQFEPVISYNQHGTYHDYMVVWSDWTYSPAAHPSVYARRLNADRTFDTPSFAVAEDHVTYKESYEPDVAYNLNHNEWLIVYTRDDSGLGTDTNVFGRRYFANGDALEPSEEAIDSSGENQREPAVAAYRLNTSNPYLVVFTDYWNDTAGDIRGYLVNVDGTPVQLINVATVTGKHEHTPAIVSSEGLGGYTVVWQQYDQNWNIYGRRIDNTGLAMTKFVISIPMGATSNSTHEQLPDVAGGSPVALAVWEQYGNDYDVYGRFLGYVVYLPLVLHAQ